MGAAGRPSLRPQMLISAPRFLTSSLVNYYIRNRYVQERGAETRVWSLRNKSGFCPPFPRQCGLGPSSLMLPCRAALEPTKTQEDVPETQELPLLQQLILQREGKGEGPSLASTASLALANKAATTTTSVAAAATTIGDKSCARAASSNDKRVGPD